MNLYNIKKRDIIFIILTACLFWAAYYFYSQGAASSFIFDDIPNLQDMGKYFYLGFWPDFLLFLLNGDSGPLGRPISLASFYVSDWAWQGSVAEEFKYVNIWLHLLNGLLVFWLCHKVASYLKLDQSSRHALTWLATALWLLNPMQVDTVLYVVQRMTELSALFVLAGMIFYIYAREQLEDQCHNRAVWLFLGVIISLILAILSKENGILLVVYILVLDGFLLKDVCKPESRQLKLFLIPFIFIPNVLLVLLLIKYGWIDHSYRSFTTNERLMSEARIIWDYLANILLPMPGNYTLLHDDFEFSKGVLQPVSTLFSILALGFLTGAAFFARKRFPVISFGVFWFLGGHLLESTTVALELYFEHRNYLPMLGPLFSLAYYGLKTMELLPNLRWIVGGSLLIYLGLTALVMQHTSRLWDNPVQLIVTWLEEHPRSQRTIEALDSVIGSQISMASRQQLLKDVETLARRRGESSYTVFNRLKVVCQSHGLNSSDLQAALSQLAGGRVVSATPTVFADFVNSWKEGQCKQVSANSMVTFIEALRRLPPMQKGEMPYYLDYWQAGVHESQGNLNATMEYLERAYSRKKDLDLLLLQAGYLASAGLDDAALEMLANADRDLCTSWRNCLKLKLRRPDLDNMKKILTDQKQEQQKETYAHEQSVHYSAREE